MRTSYCASLLLAWLLPGGVAAAPAPHTEVLVVGTIHQQHARNPNYSYEDLVRILDTYNPDLVCVEIRPRSSAANCT